MEHFSLVSVAALVVRRQCRETKDFPLKRNTVSNFTPTHFCHCIIYRAMTFKTHRSILLHPPRAAAARIQKKIVQVKIIQTFPLLNGPPPTPSDHPPTGNMS